MLSKIRTKPNLWFIDSNRITNGRNSFPNYASLSTDENKGRSNYRIGPHQTASRSFIVLHQTTDVTKTPRKDQLFYSKYCSSSTLQKNGQFVIMTDYVIC